MNTTPKKGLGKGLAALMSDELVAPTHGAKPALETVEKGPVATLPIEVLRAGKYQPRHQFDDETLHELADSIEKNGIMQPLVVRAVDAGQYEIIAGERRFRAAKLVKLREVPVTILHDVSDAHALELALVENIQRADLNPLEEAAGYQRLMKEFSYTQEKLAGVVGKSRSHVANLLRLLELPDSIKTLVDQGKLSMGHARALLTARDAEALAKKVVAEGLNVRQTETLAAGGSLEDAAAKIAKTAGGQGKTPQQPQAHHTPATPDSAKSDEVREIETMLAENLGLKVSINTQGAQAGEVAIAYETLSQLDEILRRLGGSVY